MIKQKRWNNYDPFNKNNIIKYDDPRLELREDDTTLKRHCLHCARSFETESKFIRVCKGCKDSDAFNGSVLI